MKNIYEVLKSEGYDVSKTLKSYYDNVDLWRYWWEGYYPSFHNYKVTDINKRLMELKRNSLKMAKKVSEDWANLLLTDKTFITIDETVDIGSDDKDDSVNNKINESQRFVSGDNIEQNGGVLGLSKFWKIGNKAIEKAYALGTAAFILSLEKPMLANNKLSASSVKIKCIKDAAYIIPLSYDDSDISECAVASNVIVKGKQYLYLQLMTIDGDRYLIQNKYYLKNATGSYSKEEVNPRGDVKSYYLPSKPFFILSPNIENNIADVPLGVSIFANAIDQLKGCDLAFDNLCNDFYLGRKKVYMSQDVIATEEITVTKDGKTERVTKPLAGETIEQSLYVSVGKDLPGATKFFEEYNPNIRVEENKEGIQLFLNLLSSKVGFGQNRYQFNSKTMATATEVRVSNADLTESVWKQRVALQDVLTEMTQSILKIGRDVCHKNINPDAKITIKFDDSMFSDEEAQRLRDLQEVRDGIMQKWEYRIKYYGEDEKKAKSMVENDKEEGITY